MIPLHFLGHNQQCEQLHDLHVTRKPLSLLDGPNATLMVQSMKNRKSAMVLDYGVFKGVYDLQIV